MDLNFNTVSIQQNPIMINKGNKDTASCNPTLKKIGEIAYEALGFLPVSGTSSEVTMPIKLLHLMIKQVDGLKLKSSRKFLAS